MNPVSPAAAPISAAASTDSRTTGLGAEIVPNSSLQRNIFDRLAPHLRERAKELFLKIEGLPFVDVHTHYSEYEVAMKHSYATPTEFLLGTYGAKKGPWSSPFDHYLGNVLRRQGVSQEHIYGRRLKDESSDLEFDRERFDCIIKAVANERLHPVRIWMEITLERFFGINDIPVAAENSGRIWEAMSAKLATPEFNAFGLLKQGNVVAACTTDSPTASLDLHRVHNMSGETPKLLPTFRPDAALISPRVEVAKFIADLEGARTDGAKIQSLDDFMLNIEERMKFFTERGCKAMDIGFDNFYSVQSTPQEREEIFQKLSERAKLTPEEEGKWKTFVLQELCKKATANKWTIYLHQGPERDTNSQLAGTYGFDAGGDAQGSPMNIAAFKKFLDHLNSNGGLHKLVLFPINSGDWESVLTSMAPFQHDKAGVACPLQLGPPWWFNDTIEGIEKWLDLLKQHSNPKDSIGMLSDSRVLHTVLSRNTLFRGVLAGWLVENAAGASDEVLLAEATLMCSENAKRFLDYERQ